MTVLEAFALGLLGASSLLFAGLFACWVDVPARLVGVLAGFGAGALIAAISFDLVGEAEDVLDRWQFGLWMLLGVAVFLVADRWSSAASARPGSAERWASSWARSSTVCQSRRSSGSRWAPLPDQPQLPRRGVRLEYPAKHRPVRRPERGGLERAAHRGALALGRSRLRRRGRARLPAHRRQLGSTGRQDGGARGGWPARDADQLADAVRLRAGWRARRAGTAVGFCVSLLGSS